MTLQFDRTKFYSLLEAFERVGQYRFKDKWRGIEAFTAPSRNQDENEAIRYGLEETLEGLSRERWSLIEMDSVGLSNNEAILLHEKRKTVDNHIRDVRFEIDEIPLPFDFQIGEIGAFRRRQQIENELCEAFHLGALTLRQGTNGIVNWEDWASRSGFKISFGYSIVIMPRRLSSKRKHPAFVLKSEFDEWALHFNAEFQQHNSEPIEEQMLVWFRTYRDAQLAQLERPKKEIAQAACKEYFGSENLPVNFGNKFLSVWRLLAPDVWQKGGAPKKP